MSMGMYDNNTFGAGRNVDQKAGQRHRDKTRKVSGRMNFKGLTEEIHDINQEVKLGVFTGKPISNTVIQERIREIIASRRIE